MRFDKRNLFCHSASGMQRDSRWRLSPRVQAKRRDAETWGADGKAEMVRSGALEGAKSAAKHPDSDRELALQAQ